MAITSRSRFDDPIPDFKLEILNIGYILESHWYHAAVCVAYHKHLFHIYPYIYTKA